MSYAHHEHSFFGEAVVGIDEAGRGPLAGPVVAALVFLDLKKPIHGLVDSKKASEKKREQLYGEIMERALFVAVEAVDAQVIDRINILQATLLAMRTVILQAVNQHKIDVALIDGHLTVPQVPDLKQIAWIRGDTEVSSIMAASIIAKVSRDRMMRAYEEKFPGYGFLQHKGYGTKAHVAALTRLGPCEIHRKSFAPLKESGQISMIMNP